MALRQITVRGKGRPIVGEHVAGRESGPGPGHRAGNADVGPVTLGAPQSAAEAIRVAGRYNLVPWLKSAARTEGGVRGPAVANPAVNRGVIEHSRRRRLTRSMRRNGPGCRSLSRGDSAPGGSLMGSGTVECIPSNSRSGAATISRSGRPRSRTIPRRCFSPRPQPSGASRGQQSGLPTPDGAHGASNRARHDGHVTHAGRNLPAAGSDARPKLALPARLAVACCHAIAANCVAMQ